MTDAAQPVHGAWLFRARRRGGHVDVWAGTPAQAARTILDPPESG